MAVLTHNTSIFQKILSGLSIVAALVGMAGLIVLTCFNDVKHGRTHDICLGLFIGGYIVSAIFICWEYQRLGIHYRQYSILAYSFWIKLTFIFVELGLAIAFGVLGYKEHYTSAAICEWVIALVYSFYVWSFAIDFIPAVKTKNYESRETELEAATETAMEDQQQHRHHPHNGATNGNGIPYPNGHYKAETVEPARNF